MTTELNANWTLTFRHWESGAMTTIPATVPGNVETDLAAAQLIGDYWPPDRVFPLAALETTEWVYRCEFAAPNRPAAADRIKLVFDGIDTVAEIRLNDTLILCCDNMFIAHEADVTDVLRDGVNQLEVRILPAAVYARRFGLPVTFMGFHPHQAYLRKPRHAWGWDNAPALPCSGIWRRVRFETEPATRFTEVYWYTVKAEPELAVIGVNWAIAIPDLDLRAYALRVTGTFQGEPVFQHDDPVIHTAGYIRDSIKIAAPHLWWPYGYGAPDLYDFKLELLRDGEVVATENTRIGIRVLELRRSETTDRDGSGEFQFYCNHQRIYVRGTNWKPLDALPGRSDRHIGEALALCLECHCNMVRVWGGGFYEDHEFFDWCDEHGLMVWQDFMFACEFPPQDERFLAMVSKEAEWVVKRLRNHPSLALWSGDNEIDSCFLTGNIPPKLLPSDNKITREVLKQAVKNFDPWRDYLESSPYVSDAVVRRWQSGEVNAAFDACPELHLYPVASTIRADLRRTNAHFISETGPIFINAMAETPEFIARELPRARRLWEADAATVAQEGWRHQADGYFCIWRDGVRQCLREFFGDSVTPSPDAPETLVQAVNLFCADTFKCVIEYSRVRKWRKTGVLWWSLIDMWPMMFNYSVVDYAFRKKKPFHWIRQSQQPVCLIGGEAEAGEIALTAVNDTLEAVTGTYRLARWSTERGLTYYHEDGFRIEPNGVTLLDVPAPEFREYGLHWIEWEYGTARGVNHFVRGAEPFRFEDYTAWDAFLTERYAGTRERA